MPDPATTQSAPEPRRSRQARIAFRTVLILFCGGILADASLSPSWKLTLGETTWHQAGPWWSPPAPLRAGPTDYERAVDWPLTLGRFGGALAGVALVWWLTRDDSTIWGSSAKADARTPVTPALTGPERDLRAAPESR